MAAATISRQQEPGMWMLRRRSGMFLDIFCTFHLVFCFQDYIDVNSIFFHKSMRTNINSVKSAIMRNFLNHAAEDFGFKSKK